MGEAADSAYHSAFMADYDRADEAHERACMAESEGPYTCIKCTAGTWNDDDWCDDCREEARVENERLATMGGQNDG